LTLDFFIILHFALVAFLAFLMLYIVNDNSIIMDDFFFDDIYQNEADILSFPMM